MKLRQTHIDAFCNLVGRCDQETQNMKPNSETWKQKQNPNNCELDESITKQINMRSGPLYCLCDAENQR